MWGVQAINLRVCCTISSLHPLEIDHGAHCGTTSCCLAHGQWNASQRWQRNFFGHAGLQAKPWWRTEQERGVRAFGIGHLAAYAQDGHRSAQSIGGFEYIVAWCYF